MQSQQVEPLFEAFVVYSQAGQTHPLLLRTYVDKHSRCCIGRYVSLRQTQTVLLGRNLPSNIFPQEERGRLHAEMAKMQSLEEEALLTGSLAIHEEALAAKQQAVGGAGNYQGTSSSHDADDVAEGRGVPQTEGDDSDGYSDRVRRAWFVCWGARYSLPEAGKQTAPLPPGPNPSTHGLITAMRVPPRFCPKSPGGMDERHCCRVLRGRSRWKIQQRIRGTPAELPGSAGRLEAQVSPLAQSTGEGSNAVRGRDF